MRKTKADKDYEAGLKLGEMCRKGDAQLAAAAPDLLAAVEQVLIASEDNGDMEDIDWNMLRAAVKKAKG